VAYRKAEWTARDIVEIGRRGVAAVWAPLA
jgi:hypothetical protein